MSINFCDQFEKAQKSGVVLYNKNKANQAKEGQDKKEEEESPKII